MNSEWHKRHVLPRNATMPERIAWHREHEKQCACRPIPPKLRERIAHAEPSAKTKVNAKAAKTPAEGAPAGTGR